MKVTIDISSIVHGRGVSVYTANLVRALAQREDVELTLLGYSLRKFSRLKIFAKQNKSNSKLFLIPPTLATQLWHELNFPPIDLLSKTDLFHAGEEMVPPSLKIPIVVTIHDLAIFKYPKLAHLSTLYKHQKSWQRIQKLNCHLIAVSQTTKKDIIEIFDYNPSKIHVIYEALPDEAKINLREKEIEQVLGKFQIKRNFILFVGTTEPRKNLERLIKAWQPLADKIDLVIAGEIRDKYQTSGIRHQGLKFLGRVSDRELSALFQTAKVFAYPSLYEGFGLPILQAFHFGTPVLTSNISSMPEVAGNAAELIDPLKIVEIRRGLKKLLSENKEESHERRSKMKVRLQQFSWKRAAEQTMQVYKIATEK